MNIVSSYKVKINNKYDDSKIDKKAIHDTCLLYRDAVRFFISLIEKEWAVISAYNKNPVSLIEKLSHKTKYNPNPKYDFDSKLYKFPTYLRRAAIGEALGHIRSYFTKLEMFNETDKKHKPPKLQYKHNSMPVFYISSGGLFKWTDEYSCEIKVFKNNDWVWINLNLRPSDVRYIRKRGNVLSPTIRKKRNEYYFVFPVKSKTVIPTKINTVVGVDLGLNSLATLCVMDDKGTIYKRKFIKNNKEKDLLNHLINKKKKLQRNRKSTNSIYREINNCQNRLEIYTCREIIKFALENNVNGIVFEHLDPYIRAKGSHKEKLHLWRKRGIIKRLSHLCHVNGLKYASVCARNTSKFAFDSSGKVYRDKTNYCLATFSNGKKYNCDLSASYNIAARYFIREIIKPYKEKETCRLMLEAKVPLALNGTKNTYSDLISLNVVMQTPCFCN